MRYTYFLFLTCVLLIASSFSAVTEPSCHRSGIKGHVFLVRGNQMPSPDNVGQKPAGVQTRLYVYPLTNLADVTRDGQSAFYRSISTTLLKEVETAADGSFKIKLKPGTYSLFVKQGDLFYSNIYDGKNNIYPVEVKKGEMTEIDFRADYDAVY